MHDTRTCDVYSLNHSSQLADKLSLCVCVCMRAVPHFCCDDPLGAVVDASEHSPQGVLQTW